MNFEQKDFSLEFSKENALKLIEEGKAIEVVNNINKYKDLDADVAEGLFNEKNGINPIILSGCLSYFKDSSLNKDVALNIIKYYPPNGRDVANSIKKFNPLGHKEISNKLIEIGEERSIASNLENFQGLDSKEFALFLINKGKTDILASNLYSFKELNKEIAQEIIKIGTFNYGEDTGINRVIKNLDKFEHLDNDIALELIKTNTERIMQKIGNNLASFENLSSDILDNLIKETGGSDIAKYPDRFSNLSPKDVALKLIEKQRSKDVIENIYNFGRLDSLIINKLINDGKANDIAYHFSGSSEEIKKIFDLDISVANNLITHGEYFSVLNHPDLFPEINHQDLIEKIIESGNISSSLIERLNEFKDLNYEKIIDKLIETENTRFLDSEENSSEFTNPRPDIANYFTPEMINYIKNCQKNKDSGSVYKLRNKYPLKEIINNYDSFRVKSWEEEGVLNKEDKEQLKELKNIIDEKTLGELWKETNKGEIHIIGPEILKMFRVSEYSKDAFRGQFIERITRDNSSYGQQELPALRYFHQVSQSFYEPEIKTDIEYILTEASSYNQTKVLAEMFRKESPFKDWETLKKFYELAELLKQKEVLLKLENLKKQGKEKQYKFFSDLAFHPGSKISMQTVFEFMENPAHFLDVEDAHSGEAHQRKKPSNYTKFEYLDISAEDLRDALIEGTCDKLQYFKPFEANYKIADNNYSNQEIIDFLKKALGSFKEKIKGNAKNPGKLFQTTQEILKKHKIEYKDAVSNPLVLNNEVRSDLEKALFDNNFGIKDNRKFEEYLVKIHPKSSPEGHLAGNDTACCMPFGSGKNNVYMYNLGCSILTVQRRVGDKCRTIAQSVLTPDVDIKHNIADLVNQVQNEALLSSVVEEDLTQKKKITITADNIEVAPNAEKYKNSIEAIYTDFVSRYVHAIDSNDIEKNRMLIGKGYSDLHFSRSKSINNTFIPTTPVAYSDNYGEEVYELPLSEKSEIIPLPNYGMLQKLEKEIIDKDLPKGVSYLTAHDTLRVSYMEGKVYAENESLIQYIHRIGNELTAKDINNNFKERPNLSLKIEDEKNTMLGYMIAYEGAEKNNYENKNNESEQEFKQKVIYIADLAVDTSRSKLSGGKLIKAFET